MSRRTKTSSPSIHRLRWTRRLRLSWLRWRRTSLARRLAKEAIRTQLLLQLLDSRLLEVKELELRLELTDSTLAELAESRVFRETGQLALTSGPEPTPDLDQLLGL